MMAIIIIVIIIIVINNNNYKKNSSRNDNVTDNNNNDTNYTSIIIILIVIIYSTSNFVGAQFQEASQMLMTAIYIGDLPVVKLLCDRFNIAPQRVLRCEHPTFAFKITPIVQAARCNQPHVLRLFLDSLLPPNMQVATEAPDTLYLSRV